MDRYSAIWRVSNLGLDLRDCPNQVVLSLAAVQYKRHDYLR